jgi:hypothetical protein
MSVIRIRDLEYVRFVLRMRGTGHAPAKILDKVGALPESNVPPLFFLETPAAFYEGAPCLGHNPKEVAREDTAARDPITGEMVSNGGSALPLPRQGSSGPARSDLSRLEARLRSRKFAQGHSRDARPYGRHRAEFGAAAQY